MTSAALISIADIAVWRTRPHPSRGAAPAPQARATDTPHSDVCSRTPAIVSAIMAAVPVSDCADVTAAHLARVGKNSFGEHNREFRVRGPVNGTVRKGDLAGLLNDNNLSSLPEGIFENKPNLYGGDVPSFPGSGRALRPAVYLQNNPGTGFPATVDAGPDFSVRPGQEFGIHGSYTNSIFGSDVRTRWRQVDGPASMNPVSGGQQRWNMPAHPFTAPSEAGTQMHFMLEALCRGRPGLRGEHGDRRHDPGRAEGPPAQGKVVSQR